MKSKIFALFLYLLTLTGLSAQNKPKNVILLIGDGMGQTQVQTLTYLKGGEPGTMTQFPYHGTSRTYSLNDSITDSAAGGSALSTGKKTNNGYVATNPDGLPNENLVEWASMRGKSTGIVVTSHITDATPADFYAHVRSRKEHFEIARQLAYTDLDFVVGGAINYFLPKERKDRKNLIDTLKAKGFTVLTTLDEVAKTVAPKIVALLSEKHPPKASERGDWLAVSTRKAIENLSQNADGFFLMVEGSQIDWACHTNTFDYFAEEILDFDKTVQIAYEYAQKNPETLIIVTADHETGGMRLNPGIAKVKTEKMSNKVKRYISWGSLHHTGQDVGVYAFGPGAELFQGNMENTDINLKIKQLLAP